MPRVIVTRPAREASHWVAQLELRGLAAVALPLIAIGPCTEPAAQQALHHARAHVAQGGSPDRPHGGYYRALMFVSGNAVAYFFESNRALALIPYGPLAIDTRAWSPGPGTARALAAAGVPAGQIDGPAANALQFDSESLWQQVSHQIGPGDRVLIVRGHSHGATDAAQGTGRDWLAQHIADAGGQVEFVAAYERVAPVLTAAQVALAQQAAQDGSVWLLSSSEAVRHLCQALPQQSWQAAQALATHPRIAQAACAAGFGNVIECRPALDDVVASIESMP